METSAKEVSHGDESNPVPTESVDEHVHVAVLAPEQCEQAASHSSPITRIAIRAAKSVVNPRRLTAFKLHDKVSIIVNLVRIGCPCVHETIMFKSKRRRKD